MDGHDAVWIVVIIQGIAILLHGFEVCYITRFSYVAVNSLLYYQKLWRLSERLDKMEKKIKSSGALKESDWP